MMKGNKNNSEDFASNRWGVAGHTGYQILPGVLFQYQKKLGISSQDLNVLLNILMHWWSDENKSYIHSNTIANRMGVSIRTVQRALSNLKKKGLVERRKGMTKDGAERTIYHVEGLVSKLSEIAEHELKRRDYNASSKANGVQ